eukprot:m.12983 g.12983  ORF g.12983 m.12983 type:complete len:179 (-) comp9540_c0_seq1:46-582(-)
MTAFVYWAILIACICSPLKTTALCGDHVYCMECEADDCDFCGDGHCVNTSMCSPLAPAVDSLCDTYCSNFTSCLDCQMGDTTETSRAGCAWNGSACFDLRSTEHVVLLQSCPSGSDKGGADNRFSVASFCWGLFIPFVVVGLLYLGIGFCPRQERNTRLPSQEPQVSVQSYQTLENTS